MVALNRVLKVALRQSAQPGAAVLRGGCATQLTLPWAWRTLHATAEETLREDAIVDYSNVRESALARPTNRRYIVLLFLCVLAFLTYFDRVCIASAASDIERDLRLDDVGMGLVFGAFWLSYALFEIPAGSLGDRFGARGTLSAIALAWSLFIALSGSATGLATLLAYRILFGAGEAGAYPNMATAQHNWFPPRVHARIGGVIWLVSRWGGALSYVIFPALLAGLGSAGFRHMLASIAPSRLAHAPSWRLGFWTCGIAGLVWVLLFFPWFRDDPAQKRGVNAAELQLIRGGRDAANSVHARFDARTWGLLLSSPSLWGIAIAYTGTSFGWSVLVSWMNKFLLDRYHIEFGASSIWKMMPLLAGGVACLLGGWLSDLYVRRTGRVRFGRVIFPICGSFTAAMAMFCIPLAHSAHAALALMCLASFGSDIGQASAWASVLGVGGAYAGTAFGFINMVSNLAGNALAQGVSPHIVQNFGWNAMMYTYGGAFLVAMMMWMSINPARRFDERPAVGRGFEVIVQE